MMFALWTRTGPVAEHPWWKAACRANDRQLAVASLDHCAVWTRPIAQLRAEPRSAVAWMYPGAKRPATEKASGPEVRIDARTLVATVGLLPQYSLYYLRAPDDDALAVSSSLELLRRLQPVRLNLERVVCLAVWQPDADPGRTVYREVRRLRPRESVRSGPEGIRVERSASAAGSQFIQAPHAQLASQLREQLDAAVGRAIKDAQRVVVLASGGLDSAGVLALAAARCKAEGRQLTVVSQVCATPGDDGPHLRTLEAALGISAHRLSPRAAGRWVATSLTADAQPIPYMGTCLDMDLFSTAACEGDVTLTAHAGDQLFGGRVDFSPLLKAGHALRAVHSALRLRVPRAMSPWRRITRWVVAPALPWSRGLVKARHRRMRQPWMTDLFVDLLASSVDRTPHLAPNTPDEQLDRFCDDYVLGDLAAVWGQIAAVTGAGAIDVLRDVHLVRFVAQLDPMLRFHDHMFRGLYRLAIQGLVPDSVRLRTDKAWGQPMLAEAVLGGDGQRLLRDLSSLKGLADLGLVRPKGFGSSFQSFARDLEAGQRHVALPSDEHWQMVWQLLSVEAFVRRHAGDGLT